MIFWTATAALCMHTGTEQQRQNRKSRTKPRRPSGVFRSTASRNQVSVFIQVSHQSNALFLPERIDTMVEDSQQKIVRVLQEKAILQLEVCEKTDSGFRELKKVLVQVQNELKSSVRKVIARHTTIHYTDRGEFEAEFSLVDDSLFFIRHSNVFTFDINHEIWKLSYVKDDPSRSYCGKIDVYNFLSD